MYLSISNIIIAQKLLCRLDSALHSSFFSYSSAGASSAGASSAAFSSTGASVAGASAYSTGSGCYYSVASSGYLSDLVAD